MVVQPDVVKISLQFAYSAYKEFIRRLTVARGTCDVSRLLLAIDSCDFNVFEVGLIEYYFAAGARNSAIPISAVADHLGITPVRARSISRDVSQKVFQAYDAMQFVGDRFIKHDKKDILDCISSAKPIDVIPLVFLPLTSFCKMPLYMENLTLGSFVSNYVAVSQTFEKPGEAINNLLPRVLFWLSEKDLNLRYIESLNSENGVPTSLGSCHIYSFPLAKDTIHRLNKQGYQYIDELIPQLNCTCTATTPEVLLCRQIFRIGSSNATASSKDLWKVLSRVLSATNHRLVRGEFDRWEVKLNYSSAT